MFGRWSVSLVIVLAAAIPSLVAVAHPQDGPHADIRFTVSDRDIRMNLGMNLPFLDEAIPTQREVASGVDQAEEDMVLAAVRRLVAEDTQVSVNGELIRPTIERIEIERLPDSSLYLFPHSGRAALTRFQVIAVYPCSEPPRSVSIRWAHYPPSALSGAFEEIIDTPPPMVIDAQFKAEGRIRIMRFSETSPTQTWRAGGDTPETAVERLPEVEVSMGTPLPVLSVGLTIVGIGAGTLLVIARRRGIGIAVVGIGIGAALATREVGTQWVGNPSVPEAQAIRLFSILHSNVYRAFDFTDEDDIYDTLAISVTGDLLDSLYKQIRLGLVQAENGGGIGRVTSLELNSAQLLSVSRTTDGVAFEVYAEWDVEGTVYHFGHSHAKSSPYAGLFRISQSDDGWRIDQAEPQQRSGLFTTPEEL